VYFASQHPIAASAMARFSSASSRAFAEGRCAPLGSITTTILRVAVTILGVAALAAVIGDERPRYRVHMTLLVLAAQNQAKRVWSAVRTRLVALPSSSSR